ncbi:MAG: thiamine pyrophosphate-binding protein [Pseudomonadota bacterium]
MMKTYEVIAAALLTEGVSHCFALLGDANMHLCTKLAEAIDFTYLRHEHCCVAAATAFAHVRGEVGFASVTCGPGVTQLSTALPAAVRARIPVVVFAGEAPIKKAWYNQAIDQRPIVEATGAKYVALHHPAQMRTQIRDAFLAARRNRVPVVIGAPFDLQTEAWSGPTEDVLTSLDVIGSSAAVLPNPKDIARVAARLSKAERPIILAGLGAVSAKDALEDLAEKTGALLATSLPARGLFAGHSFELGLSGGFTNDAAREIFAEADLILGFGTSFASHAADAGRLYPNAHVIQVDLDPKHINQGRQSAHDTLRADASEAAKALSKALDMQHGWRSNAMITRLSEAKRPVLPKTKTLSPQAVVAALDDVLPKDWFCVNSSGHCSYFFASMFGRHQENFLTIREFGAIGNGTSYAIGAARARPNQKIVLFDGDGSLLMHIQEFETMLRHNLNILVVVMNDGAYGSEIHKLRADGLSDHGAVFGRPDFAAMARGFGAKGDVFHTVDHLSDHLKEAAAPGLTVWDFHVDDTVPSSQIQRAHPKKETS